MSRKSEEEIQEIMEEYREGVSQSLCKPSN